MPAKGPSGGVGMVSVDGPAEGDQSLAQAFGAQLDGIFPALDPRENIVFL